MITIAVPGLNGRMSTAIRDQISRAKDIELVEIDNKPDVLIDFTAPAGVIEHLDYCLQYNIPMVIGVTGFTEDQFKIIEQGAMQIPIVLSANMSIGVNICYKLLAQAAKMFDDTWDIKDLTKIITETIPNANSNTIKPIIDMAELVIVDGTVFKYKEKCSKGELSFITEANNNTEKFKSASATFAMLSASMNDTARMTQLSGMLSDAEDREALNKQYQILKNNPIIQMLFQSLSIQKPPTHSELLSLYDKSSKMYNENFDGLKNATIIPILSFMQLMGQNLRMIRELRGEEIGLSTNYHDAIMLGKSTNGIIASNDKTVSDAYDYIMAQMKTEVATNGFSYGMAKDNNIEKINNKYSEFYDAEKMFDISNQHAWKEYVTNCTEVLNMIQKLEKESDNTIEFKKEILNSFAELAHNQTGRFIKPITTRTQKLISKTQEKINSGNTYIPRPRL